jgi:hypothetical protein
MELIYQVSLSSDLPRIRRIIPLSGVLSHRSCSIHHELLRFVGVHPVPFRPHSMI